MTYPRWSCFPRNAVPPAWVDGVVKAVVAVKPVICTEHEPTGLISDSVLMAVSHVPSRTNAEYWAGKVTHNAERDRRSSALLESVGWKVLRFWSHTPPDEAARLIVGVVRQDG